MTEIIIRPSNWVAALVGIIVALAIMPWLLTLDDAYFSWRDRVNPVAVINAKRIPSDPGEQRHLLTVQRLRDCRVVQMAAFQILPDGTLVRINSARVDGQVIRNVPAGMTLHAEWRWWPLKPDDRLAVFGEYDCDDRLVRVPVGGLQ